MRGASREGTLSLLAARLSARRSLAPHPLPRVLGTGGDPGFRETCQDLSPPSDTVQLALFLADWSQNTRVGLFDNPTSACGYLCPVDEQSALTTKGSSPEIAEREQSFAMTALLRQLIRPKATSRIPFQRTGTHIRGEFTGIEFKRLQPQLAWAVHQGVAVYVHFSQERPGERTRTCTCGPASFSVR